MNEFQFQTNKQKKKNFGRSKMGNTVDKTKTSSSTSSTSTNSLPDVSSTAPVNVLGLASEQDRLKRAQKYRNWPCEPAVLGQVVYFCHSGFTNSCACGCSESEKYTAKCAATGSRLHRAVANNDVADARAMWNEVCQHLIFVFPFALLRVGGIA